MGMSETTVQPVAARFVGQSIARKEDRRLVTGHGQYVDDIAVPGLLHGAFLRSEVAKGTITSIDTAGAAALAITQHDLLARSLHALDGVPDGAIRQARHRCLHAATLGTVLGAATGDGFNRVPLDRELNSPHHEFKKFAVIETDYA